MCQRVPDPPPDVDFTEFNAPDSPNKTARQRLTAHATNPACAGCHRIIDPIGLTLENFDGAGQFRTAEAGDPIETDGDLDGTTFNNVSGVGQALYDNPAVSSCLVSRLAAYASGQAHSPNDPWLSYLEKSFVADDYSVKSLLRRIATSRGFAAVAPPDQPATQAADAAN